MMNQDELLAIIKSQLADTIKYSSDDFLSTNTQLLRSYNQEPYGTEIDGRSQVVASDHYDLVESDMPPLVRVFLGSSKIMTFKPRSDADAEEARQKTEYAHWLIRGQRDSFKTVHDWLKEAGIAKASVVKFYPEETKRVEYVKYKGLTEDELAVVMSDLKAGDKVSIVEVVEHDEGEGTFDVEFRVTKRAKKITIANVPSESFILTRGASSLATATLAGDECTKRKGDLIAEGFDKKTVKDLPVKGERSTLEQKRLADQGGYDPQTGYHWTNDEVVIQYLYALVDMDEDGIPERRLIIKCGEKILKQEPYGIVPYALISQILMPHTVIGKSRGEYAAKSQLQKTAVERGLMDNIYSVMRPRIAVDDSSGAIEGGKVDLDDLMNQQIDGIVRTDGPPMEALMPLAVPYIGDSALQVIQYLDARKSQALGNQAATQGLNSDQFYKETATRFEGVQDVGQAKIELLARVIAETGFRQLFEGVIWTAQHYQDNEAEITVLGKQLIVDPRKWRYEHYCESDVGLGAGDSEEAITNLGLTLQTQMGLMAQGSPLVDPKKLYNTLADLTRAMGKADTSRYFNDPEQPEQLLMFENAQLKQLLRVMQQQMQDPEIAKAQIKAQLQSQVDTNRAQVQMQKNEIDAENDLRKFLLDQTTKQEQFNRQLMFNVQKHFDDMQVKLTDLDMKYNAQKDDIPGTLERT